MKPILRLLTLTLLAPLFLTGCKMEEPAPIDPAQGPVYLSKVSTSQGDERQFLYNDQGWPTKITGKGIYALHDNEASTSNVLFDNWRRLAYLITDGSTLDSEAVYHYTSDHFLYKVEELVNGAVERYHTFEYDPNRRLKTRYSYYKDLTTEDAPRAASKQTYTYDATGNVTEIASYHKPAPTDDWQLTQTQKYSDYDGKTGVQHLTDTLFTPSIILHRNNPGKETTTLASGEKRVTVFTYQYNDRHLPVKRTAATDQGNAVETTYTYQL